MPIRRALPHSPAPAGMTNGGPADVADAGGSSARHKPLQEPISPELVLVSPQLRLRALNALPERPWEAVLLPPPPEAATEAASPAPARAPAPTAKREGLAAQRRRSWLRDVLLVVVALVAG